MSSRAGRRRPSRSAAGAACAALLAAGCTAPRTRTVALGGWVTSWRFAAGMDSVRASRGRLSDIFLFVAHLDGGGNPVPARPEQDYAAAALAIRSDGGAPWITIVNDVADGSGRITHKVPEVVHAVLSDAERRRAHRAGIAALARRYGAVGVDIDYESLSAADRDLFSAFVAELKADLAKDAIALSVTVQPKLADVRAAGAGAADWAALCRSADRLQIMLYNQHSGRTGPGPVATPTWIDAVLRFALQSCPAPKIVAAIKVVGIEWTPDGTRDATFARATGLARAHGVAVQRDADGEVPWFVYGGAGQRRTVYYEDARSLRLKIEASALRGVAAVVLWSLGEEDPALWDAARGVVAVRPR